jgi:hypothetical protein
VIYGRAGNKRRPQGQWLWMPYPLASMPFKVGSILRPLSLHDNKKVSFSAKKMKVPYFYEKWPCPVLNLFPALLYIRTEMKSL